jgi:hypothetical protein
VVKKMAETALRVAFSAGRSEMAITIRGKVEKWKSGKVEK